MVETTTKYFDGKMLIDTLLETNTTKVVTSMNTKFPKIDKEDCDRLSEERYLLHADTIEDNRYCFYKKDGELVKVIKLN